MAACNSWVAVINYSLLSRLDDTVVTLERVQRNLKRSQKAGYQWLFAGPKGGMIRPKFLYEHLPSSCRMVGIDYGRGKYQFSFHSLRRAFASHLLNAGASIERVMEAGGWRSYAAVQRYAYLSSKSKKQSFKQIDRIL